MRVRVRVRVKVRVGLRVRLRVLRAGPVRVRVRAPTRCSGGSGSWGAPKEACVMPTGRTHPKPLTLTTNHEPRTLAWF